MMGWQRGQNGVKLPFSFTYSFFFFNILLDKYLFKHYYVSDAGYIVMN